MHMASVQIDNSSECEDALAEHGIPSWYCRAAAHDGAATVDAA